MHIPDGFIDRRTAIVAGALAVTGLGLALHHARRNLPRHRIPLMGLSAAFIFAAQMLNFPVIAGASGHLVGGVLAAALLGPSAALVVISAVLIVQALIFADGGITALGANIFNMGIVGTVGGWLIYRALTRLIPGRRGQLAAAAFASWCAIVAASVACAGQLAASGTTPWRIAFPAMAGIHMLIGIGEALITTLILFAIGQARPELLDPQADLTRRNGRGIVIGLGLLIAVGLALFVSPFACRWPDGLDWIAGRHGLKQLEREVISAPAPEYKLPGIGSPELATAMAGAVGTLLMFVLAWGLAWMLTRAKVVEGIEASRHPGIKEESDSNP